MLKSCCHLFIVKRSKPKSCAARLQSWDYLGQVVTNQTEPCVLCKFLHYCNAKHIKKQCQYSIKHHTYNKTLLGWLCIVHYFYIDIYMKLYTVPLLRAFCASWVMASASSKITSLKPDLQRSKDTPCHLSPENKNNDTKCRPQCN